MTQHEAPLRLSNESGDQCALFLSMSRVLESGDERQSEALDSQFLDVQPGHLHFRNGDSMASQWDAAFRQVYRLFKIFDQCHSVRVLHDERGFGVSCGV